jgi:hypothetical protein
MICKTLHIKNTGYDENRECVVKHSQCKEKYKTFMIYTFIMDYLNIRSLCPATPLLQ